jgi:hypothetical protein
LPQRRNAGERWLKRLKLLEAIKWYENSPSREYFCHMTERWGKMVETLEIIRSNKVIWKLTSQRVLLPHDGTLGKDGWNAWNY